jgi:hypothetical protein
MEVKMRINARIDDALRDKFHYLTKITGKTTSTIVREAIELYYHYTCKQKADAKKILLKNKFIASASGEQDLSEKYKSSLAHDLGEKHDHS